MSNGHGGARPGAGRKTKAELYESESRAFNDACAAGLMDRLRALERIAEGAERVEERYELALGIVVDDHETNPSGVIVKVKRQLFPDAGEDEMVLVERKVITLEPDRGANEYLANRILGKPTQAIELSGPDGGAVEISHDPRLLSDAELDALEALLEKATPTGEGDDIGDPDTAGGAGGEVPA